MSAGSPRAHDPPWPPRPEGWRHDAPDPPDAFPVPWSWVDGVVLVLWLPIAAVFTGVIAVTAGVDLDSGAGLFTATALGQVVALLGVFAWLAPRQRLSWRLLGPVRPAPRHWLIGIAAGVGGWVLVTLVTLVLVAAMRIEELPQQEALERVAEGGTGVLLLGAFVAVVLAPVVEELIFRGVLFQALRARLGVFPGMFMSSFLFAGGHVELIIDPTSGAFVPTGLIGMFGLVVFGIWLCGVLHRTGSLTTAIAAHAVFNGIALALTYILI